jgi:hypothetical protein
VAATIEVTNAAAFEGALAGIGRDLGELRDAMTAAGATATESIRAGAPHRTGAMAAAHSGRYVGANRYEVIVAHPGAAAVHWGWPAHGIRRQPWAVARFHRDERWADRLADGLQSLLDTEAGKVR